MILSLIRCNYGGIKEMTWKGIKPIVHFLDKVFEKGIKLTKNEMKEYEKK